MINPDWITLNCIKKTDTVFVSNSNYFIREASFKSRFFDEAYEIYKDTDHYFTLLSTPKQNSVLTSNLVQIKLDNILCYSSNLVSIIQHFLNEYSLQFQAFSRLDIAGDFDRFPSGILPDKLIMDFVTKKVLKVGSKNFKILGYNNQADHITGIGFGKRSSDIYIQLYNKSLEIRDSSGKKYISDLWAMNDLDTTKNIFRLEFSLKSEALNYLDKVTGEVFEFNKLEHLENIHISKMFYMLASKHFKFVFTENNTDKKRPKEYDLFTRIKNKLIYLPIEHKANASLADKIMINRLVRTLDEPDKMRGIQPYSLEDQIIRLVHNLNLSEWFAAVHPAYANKVIGTSHQTPEFFAYAKNSLNS